MRIGFTFGYLLIVLLNWIIIKPVIWYYVYMLIMLGLIHLGWWIVLIIQRKRKKDYREWIIDGKPVMARNKRDAERQAKNFRKLIQELKANKSA